MVGGGPTPGNAPSFGIGLGGPIGGPGAVSGHVGVSMSVRGTNQGRGGASQGQKVSTEEQATQEEMLKSIFPGWF